jgi:hypothetical protein
LKLEAFPGAGDYRRRPTESTKLFFVFFTVPPLKKVPMGFQGPTASKRQGQW